MVRRTFCSGLVLALVAGAWGATPEKKAPAKEVPAGKALEKPTVVLTGRLAHQGRAPVLKVPVRGGREVKTYRLVPSDEYTSALLGDNRIHGWELRVEGRRKGKDIFQVERLFSVRDGRLHKVTYFCHICNITSYKPGRCDCCQEPTEVREVPHDPEGIH